MAKVHPHASTSTCSDDQSSSGITETFTVWMKSLVFHGNGCTVFNSKGEAAFRVDNYQQKRSKKVLLMDSTGNILYSLNRKQKVGFFGSWEGFKCRNSDVPSMEKPCFGVRRSWRKSLSKEMCCAVSVGSDRNYYKIVGFEGKSALEMTDFEGRVVAKATQKQSSEGISLGDDVLVLMVEARVDQSLVMALFTVYALINNKL